MSSVDDSLQDIFGVGLNDIRAVDPFKTIYHSVFFVIILVFVGTLFLLIGVAFLYTMCDCFCTGCGKGGKKRNKVEDTPQEHEMEANEVDYR